jgi:hypothetical protein
MKDGNEQSCGIPEKAASHRILQARSVEANAGVDGILLED